MADQFDLEQGIMNAWMITSDLDVLLEELVENDSFTKDQASNFVLGLSTIYEAKFDKLFRTFEDFLKQYYYAVKSNQELERELEDLREEHELVVEANTLLEQAGEKPDMISLDELFLQEEEQSLASLLDDNDRIDFVEDEFGFR